MALIFRSVQVPLQYSRVVEPFLPAINSQLKDRRMRDFDAALGHHLHKISIRQPISDVPAHAQLDDVGVEYAFTVHRVTRDRLRHSAPRANKIRQSIRCPWMHQNHSAVRDPPFLNWPGLLFKTLSRAPDRLRSIMKSSLLRPGTCNSVAHWRHHE